MKKKKGSAIIVGVVSILFLAGLIIYGVTKTNNTEQLFKPERQNMGEKLYTSVTGVDLATNYPTTVEEIIEFNNNIVYLLYGDMLINDNHYNEIIAQQRMLFGAELLEKNSAESQEQSFRDSLDILISAGIRTIKMEQKIPIFDETDKNKAMMRVTQYTNSAGTIYWIYYMEKVNDRWKIRSWEQADSDFNLLD